ncbi:MAG: methionyl-tRNA formyltransferase [bacterium]
MSRIVFMGTPDFAVPALEALIDSQTVVGVVTQPDRPAGRGQSLRPSPVKVCADAHDIPLYQPASLRKREMAEPLARWQPEAIVVAAYGLILPAHVLQLPPRGCINVHASLLPRWRGAAPIQYALLAGDEQTGVSLMQMDEGLDTGPVFVRQAVTIDDRETAQSLHDRLAQLGAAMLREHLPAILRGERQAQPQNDDEATYAPMIKKEDGRLDWTQDSQSLDRRVRAMTPWPGAFTTWDGRRLKVLDVRPRPSSDPPGEPPAPGTVWQADDEVFVVTGQGALQLLRLQLAGKSAMDVSDFINGHPHFIGSCLDR